MKHLKSTDFDFFVLGNKATSSLEYEFIGSPGVKLLPEGIASYLQCVKLFLSDEVISNIVKYTKTKLTWCKILNNWTTTYERFFPRFV